MTDYGFLYSLFYGNRKPLGVSPADPPAWEDQWDALSEDCQKGLKTKFGAKTSIQSMTTALNCATSQTKTLTAAGNAHGIDPALLGAIGLRETGFRNVAEIDGAGVGVGIFRSRLVRHQTCQQLKLVISPGLRIMPRIFSA